MVSANQIEVPASSVGIQASIIKSCCPAKKNVSFGSFSPTIEWHFQAKHCHMQTKGDFFFLRSQNIIEHLRLLMSILVSSLVSYS